MKKIIFFVLAAFLFAKDYSVNNPLINSFFKRNNISRDVLNNEELKLANVKLFNPKFAKKIKIKDKSVSLPPYKEIKTLLESSLESNNPLAAYELLYLKGLGFKVNEKKAINVLLKYTTCDGYLYYGKYLFNTGNYKDSINAYYKALKKCPEDLKNIIYFKINQIKFKVKK